MQILVKEKSRILPFGLLSMEDLLRSRLLRILLPMKGKPFDGRKEDEGNVLAAVLSRAYCANDQFLKEK